MTKEAGFHGLVKELELELELSDKFPQHNPITDTEQTSSVTLTVQTEDVKVAHQLRRLAAQEHCVLYVDGNDEHKLTARFEDQQVAELIHSKIQLLLNAELLLALAELHYDTLSHPGNVYVRGLAPDVTVGQLEALFKAYGALVACKIVFNTATGESKGFGFVNFALGAAARAAIAALNGSEYHGSTLYLNRHISKKERIARLRAEKANFKNLYVKGIAPQAEALAVLDMFGSYGKIDSYFLPNSDTSQELKGYGFVKYESHDDALSAMEALNGSEFQGHRLQISRAQRREERNMNERHHRNKHHSHKDHSSYNSNFKPLVQLPGGPLYYDPYGFPIMPQYPMTSFVPPSFFAYNSPPLPVYPKRGVQYQDTNLYVNNLPYGVDDERLASLFLPFGDIVSAKVITDEHGSSRGFGFVCFAKALQASNALVEMNEKSIDNCRLSISFAQRKDHRRNQDNIDHAYPNPLPPNQLFYASIPPYVSPENPLYAYSPPYGPYGPASYPYRDGSDEGSEYSGHHGKGSSISSSDDANSHAKSRVNTKAKNGYKRSYGTINTSETTSSTLFNLISLIASLPEAQNNNTSRTDLVLSYLIPKVVEEAHRYSQQLRENKNNEYKDSIATANKIEKLQNSDVKNMAIKVLEDYRTNHAKDTEKLDIDLNEHSKEVEVDLAVVKEWEDNETLLSHRIRHVIRDW